MEKDDKNAIIKLAMAYNMLPDSEKKYLLGYAECAAAMAERKEQEKAEKVG